MMRKLIIPGPILNLSDYGRLQFVQNTWAGVDSLARQLSGNRRVGVTLALNVNIQRGSQGSQDLH